MLRIQRSIIEALFAQAKRELPAECCGYLGERADGIIGTHIEMTNLDKSHEHFTMDPKEQFAAFKRLKTEGLKMKAVYHSHPETPARPSEEDIRLAFDPHISYVIISLADLEKGPDIKSFLIKAQDQKPENEPIEIIED
ncbi:MAG: hypothetical protein A2527_05910 [Candidatus Lambdaproteobacteria bacterium RIFOXYD2_FULL_50_16]|uniref:JAB1/MPN/MOV34 metalloenzyme domain-containing protein n=1 Tax=Candidatus Lambdaproteobacteria bacterium RIFOXYD2_FULL_50_16 TaxID=1817772 RepID=A0A1F6G9C8_9PROT|nr:MAG: hypothetical protein A2527_05910 [Candidatus Lambdaproteobacteria bacterium RIFOXYD2_FULL_50_16]